jgi:cyclopropane fatty-acyl-phospholipid synthase-like methyltransferase
MMSSMKSLEDSILTAMECPDKEILPYLPYILQDFWEIGSDPDTIINLIKKHINIGNLPKVLDLGCGKGAVTVNVAHKLKYECYGIDAISEFISFARFKANEYGVDEFCRFEVGDIREKIKLLEFYDVIILGAIGQVFGNYYETLTNLNQHLSEDGIIIIDDGYIEDESDFTHQQVFRKSEIQKQINEAGMFLAEEVVDDASETVACNYDREYHNIAKRCQELIDIHPDKANIFLNYKNIQKIEYNNLKRDITCSTMVIKRTG